MTGVDRQDRAEKQHPLGGLSTSRGRRPSRTKATTLLLLGGVGLLLLLPALCDCFVPGTTRTSSAERIATPRSTTNNPTTTKKPITTTTTTSTTTTSIAMVYDYDLRDPDMVEMLMGAVRYEKVPLPDSMLETTLFVGNLCEFVRDDDLSEQFRSVTHANLRSLPACVVRRPNSQSLGYGFVAFPTVEEKEAAIIRFHGVEFMGRRLKVEEILDHPSKGRVQVPEQLVTYVLGASKKIPRGKDDFSLRKTSNPSKSKRQKRDSGGKAHNASNNGSNNGSGNGNQKTQGGRKGDRKQKRANVKKRRRQDRDRDFFF